MAFALIVFGPILASFLFVGISELPIKSKQPINAIGAETFLAGIIQTTDSTEV